MAISIEKLRELTKRPDMTDQEARAALNVLYGLAELIIEDLQDLQSKNGYGHIQMTRGKLKVVNYSSPASNSGLLTLKNS